LGKRGAESAAAATPAASIDVPAADRPQNAQAAALAPAANAPPSEAAAPAMAETKEVCPTCGRTSVFAGPPGHRYCMHCALRQELFDASAAAHQ
jgi:hypothetical protein